MHNVHSRSSQTKTQILYSLLVELKAGKPKVENPDADKNSMHFLQ